MSEKDQSQQNLKDTKPVMKSGEEPTELLLQLAWSPIETLQARGLARVFVGNGAVCVFFHKAELMPYFGLVPTESETVGSKDKP